MVLKLLIHVPYFNIIDITRKGGGGFEPQKSRSRVFALSESGKINTKQNWFCQNALLFVDQTMKINEVIKGSILFVYKILYKSLNLN